MYSVNTNGLTKIYSTGIRKRKVQALVDLNLSVDQGIIFGLLGPNGAGKTTLIKILLGITFPTAGDAKILNQEITNYRIKGKIGYLPENHRYPSYLTGGEVLRFFGKLSGMGGIQLEKKIDELLNLVKLNNWKKAKVKTYSKGMMQRLGLAQSLINDPELIFLDEPTDGVDPLGRKEIRDILVDLKNKSKTIFLNSHLLSEVELISDRVGILNKGRLIREGTVKELTEKKEEYSLTIENITDENLLRQLNLNRIKEDSYSVRVSDISELNKLIDSLREKKILIIEIIKQKATLEEMFISLIMESEKGEKK
ncbi:MAG TPA: ABC transporter ATP-binding protein [Ignavibacteriaceae bacterium]|nr:ABC transporter ATP-binding protein [Ignavibacteriaceae bacterium]